jgi:hypothetical protein
VRLIEDLPIPELIQYSDIKAIKAEHHVTPTDDWDCVYVEYSTVPDQTGGPFWSILNRIFIREFILPLMFYPKAERD